MKETFIELRNENNKLQKSWPLQKNKKYVLGRGADADILIDEKSASRKHAKITVLAGGSLSIQDLDSANGTFVDGKQVLANQMVMLRKGTQITLGEMKSILVIKEKIVESEEEAEEEEEEKVEKEVEKPKAKIQIKLPKKQQKKASPSRSRSRSQEKEEPRKVNFQPASTKPTVKAPVRTHERYDDGPKSEKAGYKELGLEDDEEAQKFMKLMGIKNPEKVKLDDAKVLPGLKYLQKDMKQFKNQNAQMNMELEEQFAKGVMNRSFNGRKKGLGAW